LGAAKLLERGEMSDRTCTRYGGTFDEAFFRKSPDRLLAAIHQHRTALSSATPLPIRDTAMTAVGPSAKYQDEGSRLTRVPFRQISFSEWVFLGFGRTR